MLFEERHAQQKHSHDAGREHEEDESGIPIPKALAFRHIDRCHVAEQIAQASPSWPASLSIHREGAAPALPSASAVTTPAIAQRRSAGKYLQSAAPAAPAARIPAL